ncbi:extracellular solute-binding protein [Alloalcanivorax xenomutans]|jgi:iron(III) transport system substrate-binding protein|uniref:Extracellular solute-binding protein n=1 Tax=Alloalcanivorax xenomutans TaxID=1094342 RepID=A0A9Q3ZFR2_9GAMM|nr:extracellular solute-binding protein [Alloalcanivorax xenomutans]ARB44228.1 ABC transporter substrate-binding protein [Alloalcanivorax xenomutans]MCE7508394.1 extracellular solute-binding protein [Alloalcanivorax xenomutans]MCE7525086.1 extracellular solute-binding protein [Alloalcanivorax xenomutans]WOD28728.1 extracellular solute-binding protein [Alloalcanivorax xenomutans]CUR44741.1 Ferric iron ABC transporter, iron-binding protein [Alloalcanivorax xenomutans]
MTVLRRLALPALALLVAACSEQPEPKDEVVVYTSRNDELIKPVFDAYTAQTGVSIRYITDNAGALAARLKAEGEQSPADLLVTVDAGNLWQATQENLLQPVESTVLEGNVPEHLRDEQGRWFGLTQRARTIVYSTERVRPSELSSYEALADEQWKGRLCLRTSKKVYNQSLVATMIERLGEEEAERVVRGWVDNLATDVFANDNAVMEAIIAGQCDVGIVNTYYFGRLQRDNPQLPLKLFWANQDSSGTHVNISGGGVTKNAPNREAAVALLEWMSKPEAQKLLADGNLEYPASSGVEAAEQVKAWGDFKADDLNVSVAGSRQVEAVKLMDRAGYR